MQIAILYQRYADLMVPNSILDSQSTHFPNSSGFGILSAAHRRHFAWDVIRSFGGANQWGVSAHVMACLNILGYLPGALGLIQVATTWMSLSDESLVTRPAIVGHTKLYLFLGITWLLAAIAGSVSMGYNYESYVAGFRTYLFVATFLIMCITGLCGYYGYYNVKQLSNSEDKFARTQLMRVTLFVCGICGEGSIATLLQGVFIPSIDNSITWSIILLAFYRIAYWSILVGGGVYAWLATSWRVSHSSRGSTWSTSPSSRQLHSHTSHVSRNIDSKDDDNLDTTIKESKAEASV